MSFDTKIQSFTKNVQLAALLTAACVALACWAAPAARAAPARTADVKHAAAASAIAARQVGHRYRWGAVGPRAFDCSGLAVYAYRQAGAALHVRTTTQMWHSLRHVSRQGLRPGDIVFVWSRSHGHVGVYLGHGRYVHAPAPGRRVTIAPLPGRGGYYGAVRP